MFIDSHCHLDRINLDKYQGDFSAMLANASRARVSHMLCVNVDLESFAQVHAIAIKHKNIFASVGIHPDHSTSKNGTAYDPTLVFDALLALAKKEKVIAIGETGLDYFHSGNREEQQQRFNLHIEVAKIVNKPLIIHTRNAREDTIRIMRDAQAQKIGGVMHCFTEDLDMAEKAMALGFYISFSGIVTFKNAHDLQSLVKKIPLEKILIETDAPYLTPDPYRGQPNEPAFVSLVANKIAQLRGITVQEVAAQTTKNFFTLFPHTESEN
jgi:TatD DNase family protein